MSLPPASAEGRPFVSCLLLLNDFQVHWAYFSLSDGELYPDAAREAAGRLVDGLRELEARKEPLLGNEDERNLGLLPPKELLYMLEAWSRRNDPDALHRLLQSSVGMQAYFCVVKRSLHERLGLPIPVQEMDGSEVMYRQSFTRWQAHFPTLLLHNMGEAAKVLERASCSESIVVVGDIRRSQDLMTYARDSAGFATNVVRLINTTRMLLDEYLGIFDKFTGDGFLAYFNKELCAVQGRDYRECFTDFVRDITAFAREHFALWSKEVRKLPDVEVGLAMGADVGCVLFQDIDSHFIAVGDAIIWANRMASAAKAGETVCNNLLHVLLEENADLGFATRLGATKSGETFSAKVLRLPDGS